MSNVASILFNKAFYDNSLMILHEIPSGNTKGSEMIMIFALIDKGSTSK